MYANYQDIQKQIIDILNAGAAFAFSATIDTGNSGDERRSDAAITESRRKASFEVLSAIGSNPSHSYWNDLAAEVTVSYDGDIPPYFGEIGSVRVQPYASAAFMTGIPRKPEEIESARRDQNGSFTNPFGSGTFAHNTTKTTNPGLLSPVSLWYSTATSGFIFTGYAAKISMIRVPPILADAQTFADTHIPVALAATVVKLSILLLVKEGDNLFRLAVILAQDGANDLIEIKNGAVKSAPINLFKAVEAAQRIRA